MAVALESIAGGGERGRDPGAVGVAGAPVVAAAHVDLLFMGELGRRGGDMGYAG